MGDNGELKEILIEGNRIYATPKAQDGDKRYEEMFYAISIGDNEALRSDWIHGI